MTLIFCLFLFPFKTIAQITIKERLELKEEFRKQPAGQPAVQSHNPGKFDEAGFITETAGLLRIYVDFIARYLDPLSSEAALQIKIKGVRDTVITVSMPSYFDKEPLFTPTTFSCPDNWYLYGKGPFSFVSRPGPENGQDASTSSFKDGSRNFRDRNFGDSREFGAWQDPDDTGYGFIRFPLPTIDGQQVDILSAELTLEEHQSNFSSSDFFSIHPVAGPWNEQTITWNNQPGIAGEPSRKVFYSSKTSFDIFEINVRPFVESWLSGAQPNHGFRFSVSSPSERKLILFDSSDELQRFLRPLFIIEYENPAGLSEVPTRDLAKVSRGDTVLISYAENASERDQALITRIRNKQIGDSLYSGQRFIFVNREKASFGCTASFHSTERLEGFAFIEERETLELALEIPEPKQVWPTIPPGGVHSNFDRAQVENTIEEVSVTVTKSREPVENQPVTIAAEWEPGSGGHDHNGGDDRQAPLREQMGWIVNLEEADSALGELPTFTNVDGQIRMRYRAPQFGGTVRLVAKTVTSGGDTLRAEDELTVRVPDLVPLAEGTHHKKVGGTPSHHGPRLDDLHQSYRRPDSNHFGTKAFVDSLISLSRAWHDFITADSMQDNRQTPLNINDMSLSNGGKVDIFGNFSTNLENHQYHRVGWDADIRTTRSFPISPPERNGVLLTETILNGVNTGYRNIEFEDICIDKGAYPRPKTHGEGDNEHYHIYFYPQN